MLRAVFALTPEYLRGDASGAAENYMDYGIQLGRRFRALKAWMVFRSVRGRGPARAHSRAHPSRAPVRAWIVADPHFEVMAPVRMAVVCFRVRREELMPGELDSLNEAIVDSVNESGEAYLTHTRLRGSTAIRVAIGNVLTTETDVRKCWDSIRAARFVLSRRSWKPNRPVPRAILVGVQVPSVDDVAHTASLAELGRLVKTLGYEVVATVSQKRGAIDSSAVLGKGPPRGARGDDGRDRHRRIGGRRAEVEGPRALRRRRRRRSRKRAVTEPDEDAGPKPEFVIVDHELSPNQARNLERATGAQVLDRTGVIVEIFHRHARSREAKLQVEMARLKYVAPRLRESSAGPGRQQGSAPASPTSSSIAARFAIASRS